MINNKNLYIFETIPEDNQDNFNLIKKANKQKFSPKANNLSQINLENNTKILYDPSEYWDYLINPENNNALNDGLLYFLSDCIREINKKYDNNERYDSGNYFI